MRLRARASAFLRSGGQFTAMLLIVGIAVLGVGLIVVRDIRGTNRSARAMYESSMAGLDLLNQLQYLTQEARRSVLYALTTTDSNRQVEYADQSRAADAEVAETIERHIQRSTTAESKVAGRRFAADWRAYLTVRDRVVYPRFRSIKFVIKQSMNRPHGFSPCGRVVRMDQSLKRHVQVNVHKLATVFHRTNHPLIGKNMCDQT